MKTDKNSRTHSTTSGTSSHPEQTVPDTNPSRKDGQYLVHLFWTHTDEAYLTITAKSQAEAEEKASEIESDILADDDLNPISGEIDIDSVEPAKEELIQHSFETKGKIRNCRQLRQAIAKGYIGFRLILVGGGYSRKTITINRKGRFRIVNHIDDSLQKLTARELYTKSNIGRAMRNGAFIAEGQSHE
jgi:hypothetical protein